MSRSRFVMLLCGLLGVLLAVVGLGLFAGVGARSARHGLSRGQLVAAYGRLPLSFAQNRGQAPERLGYLAGGAGWTLGLGRGGAELSLARGRGLQARLRVTASGGRLGLPVADQRLPGRVSYMVGSDHARWVVGAPTFARVVYRDVWPGVDLAFHGRQGTLEYDLDLAPGANPGRVALRFAGARAVRPDGRGGAVIALAGGTVRVPAPRAEQGGHGVLSRLVVSGETIRVALGSYDRTRSLVVDPELVYSTYLGGSGDDMASGIAVDSAGDAYVTGNAGPSFPTTPGAYETSSGGGVFVTKLNPAGTALVYSTYLGAGVGAGASGIAVDPSGDAYVAGSAGPSFPTTPGAYQTTFRGTGPPFAVDAFVTKLNPAGTGLVYSTYVGGGGPAGAGGIAVDRSGAAYITNGGGGGGFVTKLNPTGSALLYSTNLGNGAGAGAIAVDSAGDAYVTGTTGPSFPTTPGAYQTSYGGGIDDAFVAKLNPSGALVYSTYLGGNMDDLGIGVAVDSSGDAYVTGSTISTNFPTTPGAYQTRSGPAFVAKLNPAGSALLYSTYLGGSYGGGASGIAVDPAGDAYVTGKTFGSFPTTPDAYQTSYRGGGIGGDAFLTKLNPTGSALLYSTYLGGADSGSGIAVDSNGDAYLAGQTFPANFDTTPGISTNFPTTPGAYQTTYGGGITDAFVTKLAFNANVLRALQASPHTFALTGRRVSGRCVKATRGNRGRSRCTRPIRIRISYQLEAPARMTIKLARLLRGRMSHGRCVKPTYWNRKHRYCNRPAPLRGALTINGKQGTNSFTFNGRIGGHKLTPGRYQLTATPTIQGQAGTPRTVTFTIAS